MDHAFATATVDVNEEGYLTDPSQWSPELAAEMAAEVGLALTDDHYTVLRYLREQHAEGTQLTIRRIGKSGVVDIKGFYALFPGGPLKVSSKLAGIPKPTSCV
jgi:tRNA 2-thiouridine synthesizing protein E